MESRRRLSVIRLLILAAAITGLSFIGWTQGSEAYQRITAKPSSTWFAPYDDVTLTPEYHFEDPVVSPSLTQMLGFVVSDPKNPCAPTWGTYYDMDGAGRALDLDRRIVRLRERGGDAVISFGGAANTDLAVACTSQKGLNGAYSRVVKRYSSKIIDLDIEGAALSNTGANLRRAIAMRTLQSGSSTATRLRIWLTLPVAPTGLTAEAQALVALMLKEHVAIDGVNVMTMDFGGALPAGQSMRTGIRHALQATNLQLVTLYRNAGVTLTSRQVYERMGATPMIGRNDVPGETFSVSDAQRARLVREDDAPRARLDVVGQPRLPVRRPDARRTGVQHLQRDLAEAARVHLGARSPERPPAGAHDCPGAPGRVEHADA